MKYVVGLRKEGLREKKSVYTVVKATDATEAVQKGSKKYPNTQVFLAVPADEWSFREKPPKKLSFPEKCPVCRVKMYGELTKEGEHGSWLERAEMERHGDPDEGEDAYWDELWECSNCHTLFKVVYVLQAFIPLQEDHNKSIILRD